MHIIYYNTGDQSRHTCPCIKQELSLSVYYSKYHTVSYMCTVTQCKHRIIYDVYIFDYNYILRIHMH